MPGYITAGANPSIGVDFDYQITTSGNLAPRIRVVSFLFTASAAAANRVVRLQITDGAGKVLWLSENNVAQTANIACQYSFAINGTNPATAPAATAISRTASLPDMLWVSGNHLMSSTALLDAGDQFSGVVWQLDDRLGI